MFFKKIKIFSFLLIISLFSGCFDKKDSFNVQTENFAAGVLPYAVKDNKTYFLVTLGTFFLNEKVIHLWTDFGGFAQKGENVEQAAAREAHEETMGVFAHVNKNPGDKSCQELGIKFFEEKIQASTTIKLQYPGFDVPYTMFVVKVEFIDVDEFLKTRKELGKTEIDLVYLEKSDFAWVDAADLLTKAKDKDNEIDSWDIEIKDAFKNRNLTIYYKLIMDLATRQAQEKLKEII